MTEGARSALLVKINLLFPSAKPTPSAPDGAPPSKREARRKRFLGHLPPRGRQESDRSPRLPHGGRQEMQHPTKNLPRGGKIGCFFRRFPVKCLLHRAAASRGVGADICRDGGAAERARFEIVLGSDVYQGSNPCLCATENGVDFGRLRFTLHEYDRDLRVEAFAGANGLRANRMITR